MTRPFLFLLFLLVPSFVYGEGPPLKKATFLPQWKPQAQFAGFYVAKEKGFSSGRMGMHEASDDQTVAGELRKPGLIERIPDCGAPRAARGTLLRPEWDDIPAKRWRIHPRA